MEDRFLEKLKNKKFIPPKYKKILEDFYFSYQSAASNISPNKNYSKIFETLIDIIEKQIKTPYTFSPYHKKIRKPFDYYSFGIEFLKPLVDIKNSKLLGSENLKEIEKKLLNNENVILFANHQVESDPQAISILLEKDFKDLASKIIYVAGERVIEDSLAIPFSMGCDLLCIYSKKYINNPPKLKREKQLHNKKTMKLMSSLLNEGSKIIYVAPSGGRDRKNKKNIIEIAPLDPRSIEMFHLMAKKASKKTNFYPLSLFTYNILPPPDKTQIEMGEKRITKGGKIHAYFGKEINLEKFEKFEKAKQVENLVKEGYKKIKDL